MSCCHGGRSGCSEPVGRCWQVEPHGSQSIEEARSAKIIHLNDIAGGCATQFIFRALHNGLLAGSYPFRRHSDVALSRDGSK